MLQVTECPAPSDPDLPFPKKQPQRCRTCFRPVKGHEGKTGASCTLPPVLSESEMLQIRNSRKEAARKRMATSVNREADRKRKALPASK